MSDTPSSSKAKRRRRIERTRAELVRLFPKCFVSRGDHEAIKKPLARDIHKEILRRAPQLGGYLIISATMQNYTFGPKYLLATLRETQRIDLDGLPAQLITDADRAHARVLLAKHWPKWLEEFERQAA